MRNMLSNHNIEKLSMNGLYTCDPNVKYRGKLYEGNLYHCCNWTFKIIKDSDSSYFMRDTYWNSGDSAHILLTDENINEFKMIFEWDKVKSIKSHETNQYENHYRVAIDSGGYSYPKYFVDVDATKKQILIVNEIDENIDRLKREILSLQQKKEGIENGTYKLEWC